jgi:hypothetical protein
MGMLYFMYTLGLACGAILGFFFPAWTTWWVLILFFLGIFAVTELIVQLGFGNRLHDYRLTLYAIYAGPAMCALIGILLGSGKIGTLLITLGTLISR